MSALYELTKGCRAAYYVFMICVVVCRLHLQNNMAIIHGNGMFNKNTFQNEIENFTQAMIVVATAVKTFLHLLYECPRRQTFCWKAIVWANEKESENVTLIVTH